MDEHIEKIKEVANRRKYYQILCIFVGFMTWVTTNCQQSTYGFFSLKPTVKYYEIIDGKNVTKKGKLTDEICKYDNYKITSTPKSTWTYSFDIYCNKFKKAFFPLFGNFGNLVGTIILPFMIYFFGMKRSLLIAGYSFSVTICLCDPFDNYWVVTILGGVFNLCGSTLSYLSYILVLEVTVGFVRAVGCGITNSGNNISAILFMLLLKNLNSWRIPFIYAGALNLVVTIIIHIFIYESPLYFLTKNDVKGFIKTLEKISKFNRCHKEFSRLVLCHFSEDNNIQNQSNSQESEEMKECCQEFITYYAAAQELQSKEKKYSILDVLKYPSHRYNFLLLSVVWFTSNFTYTALSIDINNLPGDTYTNGFIINPIELVVFLVTGNIMNIWFLGRRGLILSCFILSLLINIIIIFVDIPSTVLTILSLISRELNASVTCAVYTYSSEYYSTKLMNSAVSWNIIVGASGTMISAVPDEYASTKVLNIIFACTVIPGIICMFFLKETLGKPIMNEIPEEKIMVEEFTHNSQEHSKVLSQNLLHQFKLDEE